MAASTGSSSISLNNIDTVKFIQLFQQQELLWNVKLPNHTNRAKRSECLMKISQLMGLNWTEQQVKDKILSLRSRYNKELVKVRVSIAAGADHYAPVWRFFPLLDSFLRPFCVTRKTNTPVVKAFHRRLMAEMSQMPDSNLSPQQASQRATSASSLPFDSAFGPVSKYHGSFRNAPMSNQSYQDDDDDDVHILEEEYAEEMAQEQSEYVDDEEYDNESSQPENARKSLACQENADRNCGDVEDQRQSLGDKEHPKSKGNHQDTSPIVTFYTEDTDLISATDGSGNEAPQVEDDDSNETIELEVEADVTQERFTSPPSPPAPPLPVRFQVMPAPSSSQDSDQSLDTDTLDAVSTPNRKASNSTGFLEEPVRKKTKQENKQTAKTTSRQTRSAPGSCHVVRDSHKNSSDKLRCSSRKQVNCTNQEGLRTVTTSQNSNHINSKVANVPKEIENQVTNVMTSQMTNLLQTLMENLVEKSSPAVTNDSEFAFVNHVVCELRKLDDDLQAEVKLSIQKTLYDAQKEMQQRKSQVSHPENPG